MNSTEAKLLVDGFRRHDSCHHRSGVEGQTGRTRGSKVINSGDDTQTQREDDCSKVFTALPLESQKVRSSQAVRLLQRRKHKKKGATPGITWLFCSPVASIAFQNFAFFTPKSSVHT